MVGYTWWDTHEVSHEHSEQSWKDLSFKLIVKRF